MLKYIPLKKNVEYVHGPTIVDSLEKGTLPPKLKQLIQLVQDNNQVSGTIDVGNCVLELDLYKETPYSVPSTLLQLILINRIATIYTDTIEYIIRELDWESMKWQKTKMGWARKEGEDCVWEDITL